MSRCWTCGSEIPAFSYRCSSCAIANRIDEFEESVIESFESLSRAQVEELRHLQRSVDTGINNIIQIVEWGFGELEWELEKQTNILSGIDSSLKSPSQTQANEWRVMSDELRRRGVIEKAKDFAEKSLEVNPLDYRTYISLAQIALKQNLLNEAEKYFLQSLPHAPKEKSFDYRSFSYRLIGHVRECMDDTEGALEYFSKAIIFSPDYPAGLYDFARYVSIVNDNVVHKICAFFLTEWGYNWAIAVRNKNYHIVCDMALGKAIEANTKYWYMAKLQPSFYKRLSGGGFAIFGTLNDAQRHMEWNIGTIKSHLDEMIDRLEKLEKKIVIKISRIFSKSIENHIGNMRKIINESRILANLDGFEEMYNSEDLITTLEGESKSAAVSTQLENLKEKFYIEYEGTPWGFF